MFSNRFGRRRCRSPTIIMAMEEGEHGLASMEGTIPILIFSIYDVLFRKKYIFGLTHFFVHPKLIFFKVTCRYNNNWMFFIKISNYMESKLGI